MRSSFETDERVEVVEALEMAREQLDYVEGHPYRWKWVIIVLHNAVQAMMVLALAGSTGAGVLKKKSAAAWLQFLRDPDDGDAPRQWMAPFPTLFEWIRAPERGIQFSPTVRVAQSIQLLNDYRNDFVHFVPASWLIGVKRFPTIVEDSCLVMRFLGLDSGQIVWYERSRRRRATAALEGLVEKARDLDRTYGT